MGKWDLVAQQLPTIVSRLQSLKKLHEEAATVSTTVAQMDEQQTEMKKLLKSNGELMSQV